MLERKEGVVIPISRARQDRGFRGKGELNEPRSEIPKETCFAVLESESRAQLGDSLKSLMNVPARLYAVPADGAVSYSSEPERSIAKMAGAILRGFPLPTSLPDYGIHLSVQGSSLFCTLVDRSRKIIVQAEVSSQYSDSGSWSSFEYAVRDAVTQAESMQARSATFGYVINKGGIITVV